MTSVCVCGIFRWSAVAPVVIRRKTTLTLKKVASISRPVISVHTRKLGGNNLNRTEENVNYVVELALRSGGGCFTPFFLGAPFSILDNPWNLHCECTALWNTQCYIVSRCHISQNRTKFYKDFFRFKPKNLLRLSPPWFFTSTRFIWVVLAENRHLIGLFFQSFTHLHFTRNQVFWCGYVFCVSEVCECVCVSVWKRLVVLYMGCGRKQPHSVCKHPDLKTDTPLIFIRTNYSLIIPALAF